MKNQIKLLQLGIVLFALLIFTSCSTEKTNLTATPNDASFVMVINGKALKEKGNINSIAESKIYKQLIADLSDDEIQEFKQFEYLFKDTKESGIAINDEFIIFMKMVDQEALLGLNFKVIDITKVNTMFTMLTEKDEQTKILQSDNIHYLTNEEAIIAWNETQLLVLARHQATPKALLEKAISLLNQPASQSISSTSTYKDFYAKEKDINFWLNYGLFINNLPPAQQMMISSQLPFSLKGTFFYGNVSFEKGQVIAEYESILNDEMKSFIKDYQFINDNFDVEVLKLMPKTSYANFEASLNLFNYYTMLLNMYKEKQLDTEVYTKQIEEELGVSINEILKSFSGEMAISLHGIQMKESTAMGIELDDNGQYRMVEKTQTKPELLFSSVIKYNNNIVWDIIESRAKDMGLQKQDGYYSIPQADIYMTYIKNTLLLTNDVELIKNDIANGSIKPNLKSTDVSNYLNHFPTYMEINMDLEQYPEEFKMFVENQDEDFYDSFVKLMRTYKKLQFIPKDMYSAKFVLELKNKDKNSLDVILHDLDEASELISKN